MVWGSQFTLSNNRNSELASLIQVARLEKSAIMATIAGKAKIPVTMLSGFLGSGAVANIVTGSEVR